MDIKFKDCHKGKGFLHLGLSDNRLVFPVSSFCILNNHIHFTRNIPFWNDELCVFEKKPV